MDSRRATEVSVSLQVDETGYETAIKEDTLRGELVRHPLDYDEKQLDAPRTRLPKPGHWDLIDWQ